jgi:antirestriction protein ArdC
MEDVARCRVPTYPLRSNGIAYDGIKALMLLSAEIVRERCRAVWKTFIQAFELRSQGRKDEQQLMQIRLSKQMIPPTHCPIQTIAYVVLRPSFRW